MTIPHPAAIRAEELSTQAAYYADEIATFEARRASRAEQLDSINIRDKKYSAARATELKQEVEDCDRELESLRDLRDATQRELDETMQIVNMDAVRLQEQQRHIDALIHAFDHPGVYLPDLWLRDETFQIHRRAIEGAMNLRARGVDIPREITITVTLHDMQPRRVEPVLAIAEPEDDDEPDDDEDSAPLGTL